MLQVGRTLYLCLSLARARERESLSLSRSVLLCLSLSHTHARAPLLSFAHSRCRSLALSLSRSLAHSLSLTHTLSHTHTLSPPPLFLSLSAPGNLISGFFSEIECPARSALKRKFQARIWFKVVAHPLDRLHLGVAQDRLKGLFNTSDGNSSYSRSTG